MQSLDQQETWKYQDMIFMLVFAIFHQTFWDASKYSQICPDEYALSMLIKTGRLYYIKCHF